MPAFPIIVAVLLMGIFYCISPSQMIFIHDALAPLDAMSAFAAFATAVSIAYAGLPNFRHRLKIQDYVREAVEKHCFFARMKANTRVWKTECGAILFTLGRLADLGPVVELPAIEQLDLRNSNKDANFKRLYEFRRFSWLYSSNLDKIISVALGALAVTIIWFAALDRVYFGEKFAITPARLGFFAGIIDFYFVNFALMAVGICLHRGLWKWDMPDEGSQYEILYFAKWFLIVMFIMSLALTSIGYLPFSSLIPAVISEHIFIPISIVLFAAIFTPLWLVWEAEILKLIMLSETDRCVLEIKESMGPPTDLPITT